MELKKVYLGKTIDGIERKLYKTLEKWNGRYYVVFMDLETREKFTENYIKSLIPYSNENKIRSRKNIIKKLNESTYHIDNIFFGDISKVTWISDKYEYSDSLESDKMFIKLDDSVCKELLTNKIYRIEGNKDLALEDLCVTNLRKAKDVLELDRDIVSKNYVLTKRYEKFKEK